MVSSNRDKAAIVIALPAYLPLPTYLCLLSSNGNGSGNIYIPLPTYRCMLSSNGNGSGNIYIPTAACLVAMAMVVVISTYLCLPACLPAYAVALAIKQAVIGRFHFEAFSFFVRIGVVARKVPI